MGATQELTGAIQKVAAHRRFIVEMFHLDPAAFDSWMRAATVGHQGKPDNPSLYVILAWTKGVPELGDARKVILRATETAKPDGQEGPSLDWSARPMNLSKSPPS